MSFITYPLNNVDYSAADAELFHVTRTSGIYAENSFEISVSGADNTVVIGKGIAWIKNGEFAGKVAASKNETSIDLGLADSALPRIDAIAIRFDANANETKLVHKIGTASSSPVAPELVQTESVYELHLCHIYRDAGAVSITWSNVTDLRLSPRYCGLMADSVTNIDTSAINEQVNELISQLREKIESAEAGAAFLPVTGGTMSGDISMSGNKVTGIGTPSAESDAVPLGYANESFSPIPIISTTDITAGSTATSARPYHVIE